MEEKKDNKNMEINDSEQEVVWVLREWQDCPTKRNTANKAIGVGTGRSWGGGIVLEAGNSSAVNKLNAFGDLIKQCN